MHTRNPWVAGILSGVVPGLGQFYNRQWGKGAGFLLGSLALAALLVAVVDLKELEQAVTTGTTPEGLWKLMVLELLLLGLFIWSIADAARAARKS